MIEVYSATGLEEFVQRTMPHGSKITYMKSRLLGFNEDFMYNSDFRVAAVKALERKKYSKIPLIFSFDSYEHKGKMGGDKIIILKSVYELVGKPRFYDINGNPHKFFKRADALEFWKQYNEKTVYAQMDVTSSHPLLSS